MNGIETNIETKENNAGGKKATQKHMALCYWEAIIQQKKSEYAEVYGKWKI